MNAKMWLSVFRVHGSGRADRPDGMYGAAFVSYEQGSPLTYRELVVARLHDARSRQVRITDIWVDSEESRAGGRSLWAIPKDLAQLDLEDRRLGPAAHTAFAGQVEGRAVASGRFVSVPGVSLVRTPFSATTSQPPLPGRRIGGAGSDAPDGDSPVLTPLTGSARTLPALAAWEFPADGPLGFLHGRRPLVSFRLTHVRLRFG
jgi:hypothetical protein